MVWPAGKINFERRWSRLCLQTDAGSAHQGAPVQGRSSLDGFAPYRSINQTVVSVNHIGTELVSPVKPFQSPVNDLLAINPSGSVQLMKSHGCHRVLVHRINLERFHDLASIRVIQPRPPAVGTLQTCEAL